MSKLYSKRLNALIEINIPRGQDGIWAAARRSKAFTVAEIERLVEADKEHIADYLRRLERGGFLKRLSNKPAQYQLVEDQAETPRVRHDGTLIEEPRAAGQDNMWRAIKMLRDFDGVELARAAQSPGVRVAERSALQYIVALHAAGYLIKTQDEVRSGKKGQGGRARYALNPVKNTGPQAPQIQRCKALFDPNIGQVVSLPFDAERVL
ncbi:MAG TPA: hypothetical protein PKZ97_09540 [Azospirillaceae bacterium]|nr:hypothetical protein [Azospirillaceae bacterium]